jgi:hypothetical protein
MLQSRPLVRCSERATTQRKSFFFGWGRSYSQAISVPGVSDISLAPDGRAVLLLLNGTVMEAGTAALAVPQELQTTQQVSI